MKKQESYCYLNMFRGEKMKLQVEGLRYIIENF